MRGSHRTAPHTGIQLLIYVGRISRWNLAVLIGKFLFEAAQHYRFLGEADWELERTDLDEI